ncbi:MAG: CBS and ACT domain-containing protein [Candidatus Sedimenticola sp. (ex Thyasira tokunagai)]
MYVSQIMTSEVDSATEEMKLSHAAQIMRERDRRYLPVVDADNRLIGLFSHKHLANAEPSSITTLSVGEVNYLTSKVTVGQLMEKAPVTCRPETLVEVAGCLIREHKVGCLPVIDDGKMVGVVSETDILDFFLNITGCALEGTTRIAVLLEDKPRSLSRFLDEISNYNGTIATVVSPVTKDERNQRMLIVRYQAEDPAELDNHLKELGYEVVTEELPPTNG